jgi:two-component system, OmpR family, phosphate regulon sensor histidine kinase PhoR
MRIGVRGRIFLAFFGLLAASVAAAEIYLLPAVEHDLTDRIRQDLHVRLNLIAERAASAAASGATDWDGLADRLGPIAGVRVTLVRPDGTVAGDSEVEAAKLAGLEDHRTRPEVASALAGKTTDDIRYSATVHKRMLYAATPVSGPHAMVARASLPLAWVDSAKDRTRRFLLGGAAVALVVAILLSSLAAVLMSRGLRKLTTVARRMAGGDLEARSRLQSPDELGELGRALDQLAAGLSRTLRELRDDRDLLGRILESMREGVLVMDGEHRILLANPSLRDMLALGSDVLGRSTIEVIRNADLHGMIDKATAASETLTSEIEVGGIKPRRLLVHAAPLSGEPRALLLVLFDVTEMRHLETIRRDFVANVSHELRTPIASLRSAAETLRMALDRDPKGALQFVDIIERNSKRLGDLIGDLLDLSKIEARELRLSKEALDVPSLVEKTLANFAERAAARSIRLTAEMPAGLASAAGDANAFDRVLTNLVDNAFKYCPDGARVTVGAGEDDHKIVVTVADTGPGIEERHLSRLFERFYRVDPGRSREMGGTGLGLSIVKHLVEAMGGEVRVESQPGKGSAFAFSLPRST